MSIGSQNRPAMSRMVLWIIWIAMTQSVILYAVIVKMGTGAERMNFEEAGPNLNLTFSIIAVITIAIAFGLRFTLLQSKPALAPTIYIAILALAEIPGLFGLILGLQGTPLKDLYTFFGMSILSLVALSPAILPKAEKT